MKLTVTKLGRIDHAEIELKPLTVFVGPNNTNKSWTAWAAYGLMSEFARATTFRSTRWRLPVLDSAIDSAVADFEARRANSGESATFATLVERAPLMPTSSVTAQMTTADLADFIPVPARTLLGATASLSMTSERFSRGVYEYVHLEQSESKGGGFDQLHAAFGPTRYRHTVTTVNQVLSRSMPQGDNIRAIMRLLVASAIPKVVPLPVERQSLQGPLGDQTRYVGDNSTTYGQHVADWMGQAVHALPMESPSSGINQELLAEVLGGRVTVDDDNAVRFEVGGTPIPLRGAASMVRSLALLSLYIERLASPGDVLVIDEPEMNAHPRAQLAIAEFFAVMINAGYRILFTTHSPYIVDHLNNLMTARVEIPEADRQGVSERFMLRTPDAFLDPNDVAAYEFVEQDDGSVTVEDAFDPDEPFIATETFGRESERLSDWFNLVLRRSAK